ncbi:ribonuclease P protein component [Thermophilibacter immobilis]|jgi:ribonuclease P protein component|uniref:Ribonuclease P protein component n=1 Tax=Thermophilibacter immobilis TaxID=2779519 RepID=A0A7S7M8E2_9ACTN|nr:ribonuclease P protein component [Thermophilibacter immobilis]QOY60654.1 ribonuclease P protein component [Thermophilibacter immobilis]
MKTIKSKQEFEEVFSRGKRLNDSLLRIRVAPCDEGTPGRVAFVAAKRIGNAVFRNRCKRVLREAARMSSLPQDGYDVILFSTRRTHDSSPEQVSGSLRKLLGRGGA